MTIESTVKKLCRGIEELANEKESSAGDYSHGDHAQAQAIYESANTLRQLASVIGHALIGTEDFKEEEDGS